MATTWPAPRKLGARPRDPLIGAHAGNLADEPGQLSLLGRANELRREKARKTVDTLRDRFGESAVATLGSLQGGFRERVHENPASLPGKGKPKG